MGIEQYSTTPSSNSTPSPPGISGTDAPSSIVTDIRQLMADIKVKYNDDGWGQVVDNPSTPATAPTIAPVFATATTFTMAQDVTSAFHAGRRVKLYGPTMGTLYGTIRQSTFSSPNTTITVGVDGGSSLLADLSNVFLASPLAQSTNQPLFVYSSAPNVLIGGNLDTNPWQRGTSFSVTATNTYTADNLKFGFNTSSTLTVTKDSSSVPTQAQSGVTFKNAMKIVVASTDTSIATTDFCGFFLGIEGYDWQQIGHTYPVTISFWIRSSVTGVYGVSLRNSGLDRCYVNTITINSANTWEYKKITAGIAPNAGTWDYTNGVGISLGFTLASGSNFFGTADSWAGSNLLTTSSQVNFLSSTSNNMYITGIQINPGQHAATNPFRSRAAELALCQRYYEKSYDLGTNPGTNTNLGAAFAAQQGVLGNGANATLYTRSYKVTKRTDSNPVIYSIAGNTSKVTQDDTSEITSTLLYASQNTYTIQYTNGSGRWAGYHHFAVDSSF